MKNIKCYKCGRFGHLATNCKADKFKVLELHEPTQDKLYELLYESDSNSNSSGNSSDYSTDSHVDNGKQKCVNCPGDTCT